MTRKQEWVAEKFDKRAASYENDRNSSAHRWQAERAVEFLTPKPGQRVLDVGTGTGLAARLAAEQVGPTGAVIGIDLSGEMLRHVHHATQERCWFLRADAAAPPFTSDVFDAVLCVAAAPYFYDLADALAAWRRICTPLARAVVSVPAVDGITSSRVLRQAAAEEGIDLPDPGGSLADPEKRDRLADASGWMVEQVSEVSFTQPLADTVAAFEFIDSGFADPLRAAPNAIRNRVRTRFDILYRQELVEEHRVVLVRLARRVVDQDQAVPRP